MSQYLETLIAVAIHPLKFVLMLKLRADCCKRHHVISSHVRTMESSCSRLRLLRGKVSFVLRVPCSGREFQ